MIGSPDPVSARPRFGVEPDELSDVPVISVGDQAALGGVVDAVLSPAGDSVAGVCERLSSGRVTDQS